MPRSGDNRPAYLTLLPYNNQRATPDSSRYFEPQNITPKTQFHAALSYIDRFKKFRNDEFPEKLPPIYNGVRRQINIVGVAQKEHYIEFAAIPPEIPANFSGIEHIRNGLIGMVSDMVEKVEKLAEDEQASKMIMNIGSIFDKRCFLYLAATAQELATGSTTLSISHIGKRNNDIHDSPLSQFASARVGDMLEPTYQNYVDKNFMQQLSLLFQEGTRIATNYCLLIDHLQLKTDGRGYIGNIALSRCTLI